MDDKKKWLDLTDTQRILQGLSAVADGEADGDELRHACQAWRDDTQVRGTWHAYTLIGDVLRSGDLAGAAGHDRAFLERLRERLAQEPVVTIPLVLPAVAADEIAAASVAMAGARQPDRVASLAPQRRLRRWNTPMAMAAGVLTVVGVVVVMRGGVNVPGQPEAQLALQRQAAPPQPLGLQMARSLAENSPEAASAALAADSNDDATVLRSPEIDRYLNAHRRYAQVPVLAAPGGLRQVAATPSGR